MGYNKAADSCEAAALFILKNCILKVVNYQILLTDTS